MGDASEVEHRTGNCETCGDGTCSAKAARDGEPSEEREKRLALRRRLCRIGRKVLVLSGKGGVGKSTVAVNLAAWLSMKGKSVGLLDVDIHGPSVPRMLGLRDVEILGCADGMLPVEYEDIAVMSIGFLLKNDEDAVIWRGPRKMAVIRQFLAEVVWGNRDFLIVDVPPGTGDEPLSVCQLIEDADGAVVVTTPQEVALGAVRRSITFCRELALPVIGVVENMSGFVCPKCGERTELFKSGGGERLAREMHVPFLGRIPLDPALTLAGDDGHPLVERLAESATARALESVFKPILDLPRRP
jgi:Mrp family chromosome partitioning ATPase